MSFLQDPKIYKTILDSVIKRAQERAARPVDINAVAKKLADNLARELGAAAPAENITAAGSAGITLDDLYSLPSLLQFISLNKLKINGKQIAYTKDEADALPDSSNLTQIGDLFVDMPLLGQYVNHLQEKAKSEANTLLHTSLGNLIDQIKEIDPKALIQKIKEKSTPESPNVIDDNAVVDRFSKKIFDPKNPMANTGNDNLLFAKNLKTAGALNGWLRDLGGASVIMYTDNQAKPVSFFDEHANRCIVPQVLYKRALQYYNTGDDEQRRIAAFYMKRVQEIAGQFTGPDNQACTIEGAATTPATTSTETSASQIIDVTNLIKSVPLRMRDLSFQRINYFFDQYQKVLGDKRGAGVVAAITNARQAMNNIKGFLNNPNMDLFNLNAGPEEVKTWLKPPQGKYYLTLLDHLESVLANTGYVIRDLQAAYGDDDRLDSGLKNVLGQQIGYGSGSGSIYGNNFSQIMRLKSLVRM